jgi:solute carrier family 39 (zinc transporter), member 5
LSPLAFAEIVYNRDVKAAQYFTVDSILITPKSFLELCPALLVQIEQKACDSVTAQQQEHAKHMADHGDENHSQSPRAWLYASCSIFLISLCGVFGIVLVPLAEFKMYDKILRFLVALATGTLCGDALMVSVAIPSTVVL